MCSKYLALLTPVMETLRSLLFPFNWVSVYVPVLGPANGGLMDGPIPTFFGFHGMTACVLFPSFLETLGDGVRACNTGDCKDARRFSSTPVFVDLDRNEVIVPPSRPLIKLPEKPRADLVEALKVVYRKGYGLHRIKVCLISLEISSVSCFTHTHEPSVVVFARSLALTVILTLTLLSSCLHFLTKEKIVVSLLWMRTPKLPSWT